MTEDAGIILGFAAAGFAAVLDGVATVAQATAAQRTGSPALARGALYVAGLVIDVLGWGRPSSRCGSCPCSLSSPSSRGKP